MIAGNSLPRSGSIRWSCLSYQLTVVYVDAKSEPCLLVMHSRCLRHFGEIADGSHHASAMKQNLCCLLHSVSSFSTQLLVLYIYSSCSCRCQHNCYLLYNRCTCSSYPFFITTILQAHLGASWLPNCTKILHRELVKTVSIPAQERKVQCTIISL